MRYGIQYEQYRTFGEVHRAGWGQPRPGGIPRRLDESHVRTGTRTGVRRLEWWPREKLSESGKKKTGEENGEKEKGSVGEVFLSERGGYLNRSDVEEPLTGEMQGFAEALVKKTCVGIIGNSVSGRVRNVVR